ncbi:MAG: hypothetical protein H0T18_05890 [Chloroflexia bacterium]|nr:hypothetical protein [Chloroflexia bacterium]
MAQSPAATEPELTEDGAAATTAEAPADASPGPAWVRPAAVATLVSSVVGSAWLLSSYRQRSGSLDAALDSPHIAGALTLGLIAVMSLAVVMLRPERGALHALVATSAVWSVALVVALVVAWAAVSRADRQDAWHGVPVTTAADVDAYLADYGPAGVSSVRIPTGVHVQSMEFLNGDNVQMAGYVWQRFGPDVPQDLLRGVVLPEAVEEAYELTEAYRFEENGVETIGWYFAAVLRQPFEYAEFPFDEQNAWLRIWDRDFSGDVVLVPDFAAYTSIAPASLPGVEEEFVYSGWTPMYSGFSYSNQPYQTSFGMGDANELNSPPELYFNLVLERSFVGPFFEHFIFAIAAACLLFGLLVLTTNDERLKSQFQLTTSGVLGAATGLLFAVILKHNQLRGGVSSRGVTYIEVIPIILYVLVVVVVLNAILLASPVNIRFIEHRNNMLPKLAYWPVLLGLVFAATLAVLFRA